jgi:hypothetical protein
MRVDESRHHDFRAFCRRRLHFPRHQPEEATDIEALQVDGAFRQLRADQKSAQYEKDCYAVLVGLCPRMGIAMNQGKLNVIEKDSAIAIAPQPSSAGIRRDVLGTENSEQTRETRQPSSAVP